MGNAVAKGSLGLVLSASVAVAASSGAGCRDRSHAEGHSTAGAAGAEAAGATAAPDTAPAAAKPAEPTDARKVEIPWISDDYAGALKRAQAEKKPIFVDMWAPWCHTCLAMKQVVMVDPSLAPLLDRFVWLELDTDRPVNAEVLTRLKVDVWPTFYVLSPEGESVQARHLGAASIGQLREMLEQGEAGHQDAMAASGKLPVGSPLALVRDGDRAAAAGDMAAADKAYGQALAAAPERWPRTADVLVKQIAARYRGGDKAGCADLGMREGQRAGQGMTASATDFAYYAGECAGELDEPRARLLRGRLLESVRAVLEAPDSALSIDDESDALVRLRELSEALGDSKTARAMAVRQRDLLDRATAEAPTPLGRMTYVWPRSEVYMYLGEAEKLVPDLQKLAADLPKEYDPPYRLAAVYLQIGKLDEALKAAGRAVELVYGPRKGRALAMVAEIHKARGDAKSEKAARKAVVDYYASLPPGHRSDKALADARAALAAVGKPDANQK
jgi:tetratricopeptide (TPR) repeat protein